MREMRIDTNTKKMSMGQYLNVFRKKILDLLISMSSDCTAIYDSSVIVHNLALVVKV